MEAADAKRALTQNPQATPSATASETAQTSVVVSDEARPMVLTSLLFVGLTATLARPAPPWRSPAGS
jgi:hypothetical protein